MAPLAICVSFAPVPRIRRGEKPIGTASHSWSGPARRISTDVSQALRQPIPRATRVIVDLSSDPPPASIAQLEPKQSRAADFALRACRIIGVPAAIVAVLKKA
jgi:hypothetical protein